MDIPTKRALSWENCCRIYKCISHQSKKHEIRNKCLHFCIMKVKMYLFATKVRIRSYITRIMIDYTDEYSICSFFHNSIYSAYYYDIQKMRSKFSQIV